MKSGFSTAAYVTPSSSNHWDARTFDVVYRKLDALVSALRRDTHETNINNSRVDDHTSIQWNTQCFQKGSSIL